MGLRLFKKVKGNPGEIDAEVPYKIAAAPDGSPSATSSAATFGYHYTLITSFC